MTIQCCKCKRFRHDREWSSDMGVPDGPISHSYCPSCYRESVAEFARELTRCKPPQERLRSLGTALSG